MWGFGLSWGSFGLRGEGGIRGGEAFGLSWRGFRAFAGIRRASGFGGRLLGEGFGLWWEDFGLGEDLGFRGGTSFRGEEFRLSNRFYESEASGSPLKTNRSCESNLRDWMLGQPH